MIISALGRKHICLIEAVALYDFLVLGTMSKYSYLLTYIQ